MQWQNIMNIKYNLECFKHLSHCTKKHFKQQTSGFSGTMLWSVSKLVNIFPSVSVRQLEHHSVTAEFQRETEVKDIIKVVHEPCNSSARCLTPEQLLLPAPEKTACQIPIIRDNIILSNTFYVVWMSSGGLYNLLLSTVSCFSHTQGNKNWKSNW